jgi:hypothetical protein
MQLTCLGLQDLSLHSILPTNDFFFVQVRLYAAMGKASSGQGSIPRYSMLPKSGFKIIFIHRKPKEG